MKLSEIVSLAIKKAECPVNATNEAIVKGAINTAYLNDFSKIDKRLAHATLTPADGIATLPNDCLSIEVIKPALIDGEMFIGNSLVTDRTDTFDVLYSKIRTPLVSDTEEPDLKLSLQYALAIYGAYFLTMDKGNVQLYNQLMNEYQMLLKNETNNASSNTTKPVVTNYWDIVSTAATKLF